MPPQWKNSLFSPVIKSGVSTGLPTQVEEQYYVHHYLKLKGSNKCEEKKAHRVPPTCLSSVAVHLRRLLEPVDLKKAY